MVFSSPTYTTVQRTPIYSGDIKFVIGKFVEKWRIDSYGSRQIYPCILSQQWQTMHHPTSEINALYKTLIAGAHRKEKNV